MQWKAIGLAMATLALAACNLASAPQPGSAATTAEAPATQALRIEVWHDLVCPWCRIGLHNLETALGDWDRPVEVVHRSYILDPSIPSAGADMMERMAGKMGSEERVKAAHARVAQAGAQYGLEFDFEAQRIMPQTAHTHAVIAWAPVPKRRALVRAIHDAHFLQGKNIGDPQVLGALAASVGLDAAAASAAAIDPERLVVVRAEARSAQHAGVRGVPHIVIGDRVLRGAQPPAAILQAITDAAAAGATVAK